MSYILEALKKAEDERKQEGTPALLSMHAYPPSFTRHRSVWPVRAAGFSLLLLILAAGFYGYRTLPVTKITTAPANVHEEILEPPKPAVPGDTPEKPVVIVPGTSPEIVRRPLAIKSVQKKIRLQLPPDLQGSEPRTATVPAPKADELPFLDELSAEVRAGMPEISLAGHTYSVDPQKRMIIINGRILKEGDMIDSQTTLTEITWEGVVIQSRGVRFQAKNH